MDSWGLCDTAAMQPVTHAGWGGGPRRGPSGWNGQGQLGCGNYFDQHTPAPMAVGDTKGATVTAIAGGGYHTALVAGVACGLGKHAAGI